MRFKMTLAIAAAVMMAVPAAMRADTKAGGAANPATSAIGNPNDAKTLAELQHSNVMEIEMGKLAKSNGSSKAVKDFGDRLVTDHKKAQEKTEEVAKQIGVKLPEEDASMAGQDHDNMQKLKVLKGAAFDQAFVKTMADDHAKDIATLESEKAITTGPVTQLLTDVLPVLKQHAKIANQLVLNPNIQVPKPTN